VQEFEAMRAAFCSEVDTAFRNGEFAKARTKVRNQQQILSMIDVFSVDNCQNHCKADGARHLKHDGV
jgi:hypothetical protein